MTITPDAKPTEVALLGTYTEARKSLVEEPS